MVRQSMVTCKAQCAAWKGFTAVIKLKASGHMGGDATYPYDAIMDKPYTVREFVDEVVSGNRNWGVIRYTTSTANRFGEYVCDYRYGDVIGEIDDGIANRRVTDAWGSGGWSRYDFTLLIA